MPQINHENLGDIQRHEYLTGIIITTYHVDEATSEDIWDTADVYIVDLGITWYNAPIFYHCNPSAQLRDNGAVMMGAKGFTVNDNVILLCKIVTSQSGSQLVEDVKVIGHVDGIKQCSFDYVMVRMSTEPLSKWDASTLDNLPNEYCIIYDVEGKSYASIVDPDTIGTESVELIEFPCEISKIQSFFQYATLRGVPLFEEYYPQGDDDIQIAGGSPDWKTDLQGNHIRAGIPPEDWHTSYDVDNNPTIEFFEDLTLGLMLDDEGSSNGTYARIEGVVADHESDVTQWDSNSAGFCTDEREYAVPGPDGLGIAKALGVDGFPLGLATSKHIQMAYGEDEIWVCGINSFGGVVVSYCDAKWKFTRLADFPPVIPVPGLGDKWLEVANDAALASTMPGGMAANTGEMIQDIDQAMAGDASLAGLGGENNIFSQAYLKRINEGGFHHTKHPAQGGSQVIKISPIPENPEKAPPQYLTAINYRWDKINVWYRWDNWMNTYGRITSTFGVDPTWWMQSYAQQWGCDVQFVETPIGTMWHASPNWKAMVWMQYGMTNTMMTARQDKSLCQDFKHSCKHSRSTVCQLYINQRTSITLWSVLEDRFILQTVGVLPYDCIPTIDEEDPIAYAQMPDGNYKHFDLLTEEEIESLLSDRIFLRTPLNGESIPEQASLRLSRNEIEIMGATDLYGDLELKHTRKNPIDQERTPEFEKAVQELVEKVFTEAGVGLNSFTPLFMDMEII